MGVEQLAFRHVKGWQLALKFLLSRLTILLLLSVHQVMMNESTNRFSMLHEPAIPFKIFAQYEGKKRTIDQ